MKMVYKNTKIKKTGLFCKLDRTCLGPTGSISKRKINTLFYLEKLKISFMFTGTSKKKKRILLLVQGCKNDLKMLLLLV